MYIMGMKDLIPDRTEEAEAVEQSNEPKLEQFSKKVFFSMLWGAWVVFLLLLIDIFIL
jgi:hypothetical protein